jgi:hypothetical protein
MSEAKLPVMIKKAILFFLGVTLRRVKVINCGMMFKLRGLAAYLSLIIYPNKLSSVIPFGVLSK